MALGRLHTWAYEARNGRVLGCVASDKRRNAKKRPVCALGKTKKKAIAKARKIWKGRK